MDVRSFVVASGANQPEATEDPTDIPTRQQRPRRSLTFRAAKVLTSFR